MVKRSINGQQRVNKRMLPKRFERLEIDTTRLLTAAAKQSDNTIQDTQRKKEYNAQVSLISYVMCSLLLTLGVILLCTYDIMFTEEKKNGKTSLLPEQILISGCVSLGLAFIAFIICWARM
jgi:uncharacterized Tic20 family protein